MEYKIYNRWNKKTVFIAEIENEPHCQSWRKRLAVLWAIKNNANMRDADFSGANMRNANMRNANMSNAIFSDADMHNADMRNANMSNAFFSGANMRNANMRNANMRNAFFSGADMRDANMRNANMRDAFFSGANMRTTDMSNANMSNAFFSGNAIFSGANMSNIKMHATKIKGADMRGAQFGTSIKIKDIHRTVYKKAKVADALYMAEWHSSSCRTVHCRAGWVVHLAGEEGYKLESEIGPSGAAAIIYMNSDPGLKEIPDFYTDRDTALADMKYLAEMEERKENERTQ